MQFNTIMQLAETPFFDKKEISSILEKDIFLSEMIKGNGSIDIREKITNRAADITRVSPFSDITKVYES